MTVVASMSHGELFAELEKMYLEKEAEVQSVREELAEAKAEAERLREALALSEASRAALGRELREMEDE